MTRSTSPPELRIPKIPVAVELNLDRDQIRRVEVFVAEHLADAFRRQHVADLVAGPEQFLPARDPRTGELTLFNKAVAIWVRIPMAEGSLPVEETEGEAPEELFESQHVVAVEFRGGESMTGDLLYSLPPDRARPADYFNQRGRFFRLWTAEHLYLVNKDFVVAVRERDSEDR